MTPSLVLFLIAVTVAITCLLFWLRRLTTDFQHLQGNYIELHAMHSELNQRHQWLANDHSRVIVAHEQALVDADGRLTVIEDQGGITARTNALATLPHQDLKDQVTRAKILMYQISAAENLAGNKAPTLYGGY